MLGTLTLLSTITRPYRPIAMGDQKFGLAVDWVVSALIEAEALRITQSNVAVAV